MARERKYLFDAHNFDAEDIPLPDPAELAADPPPPIFTLDELSQTKDEAFHQGRLTALEEAADSRAQYIATQVEKLAHDIKGLILSEQRRNLAFQNDVLALCEAVFSRAFPAMNHQHGMGEVLHVIRQVLPAQQDQEHIIIEVPAGESEEILAELQKNPGLQPDWIDLREHSDLSRGSCRLSWKNGGAGRDHEALTMRIVQEITKDYKKPAQPSVDTGSSATLSASPLADMLQKDDTEPETNMPPADSPKGE